MSKWYEFKKEMAIETINRFMKFSSHLSNSQLILLTSFAERLAKEKDIKNIIILAKKKIREGHPWVSLAKRIFKDTDPNYRRLIINFFINSIIYSTSKRREIKKEKGFLPPFSIVISPSMKCNLKCKGCYAEKYDKQEELSFGLMDSIIDQGKKMGIFFYTISGGEPFFKKDLLKVYEKHNDCVFHVYTNGTLLNKSYVKKLVKLGNVIPLISIEGSIEETDFRRGKGIYGKVMLAMDNLKESGVPFGFSVTHTSMNTKEVLNDKFIDLMIEKGAILGWFFQYIPIGQNPDLSFMPSAEDRNLRRATILRWRNTKSIIVYDFWNDGPPVEGCIAGGRYLHIISNGDVEPCVFVHFAVDNIKNRSLEEILTSPFFQIIQKRQPYMDEDEKEPNYLRPCMIIDHPDVLREVVKEANAHPTCYGADQILSKPLSNGLDELALSWKKIITPIWQKEYQKYHKDHKGSL